MIKQTLIAVSALTVVAMAAPAMAQTRTHESAGTRYENMMLSEQLKGDERMLADAYSRAAIAHANLIAGDWNGAQREIGRVRGDLDKLSKKKELNARVKTSVSQLASMATQLETQIKAHEPQAMTTARELVARFNTDMSQLASEGAIGTMGGGAGTGGHPQNKGMNR